MKNQDGYKTLYNLERYYETVAKRDFAKREGGRLVRMSRRPIKERESSGMRMTKFRHLVMPENMKGRKRSPILRMM